MLKDVKWAEDGTYRPGEVFSPDRLFDECLHHSNEFDLQLGYFSSATISVLADGFATFIANGGKMRLAINNIVSSNDKDAIEKGIIGKTIDCMDLSDFDMLRRTFDEYQEQFFECLAYLIKTQRIDLRIIKPKGKKGIAHTKSGQFRDGDSITSFSGSANFTISGLFNNLEEIKIDRSDSIDEMVQNRIVSQRKAFDRIMSGSEKKVEYLSPDKLISVLESNYGDKEIEELLDVERKLRIIKKKRREEELYRMVEDDNELEPVFPYPQGPRDYQKQAFENWLKNGQKGLFAMATGTGKTLTALNVLLEIYKRKGYYKAVILVPTITLVKQWEEECRKFRFDKIITICARNPKWKNEVDDLLFAISHSPKDREVSFVIISTYVSFARKSVFAKLCGLSKSQVLFIADEAHNMGAGSILKLLPEIPYLRRIGLSATPERQFDDSTNKKLLHFFGAEKEYTFEYSMELAIQKGVLCKYLYFPHLVELTESEMEKYEEYSIKISKYFNYNNQTFDKKDDILMSLLLARKRIIHKAANKLEVFKLIIQERYNQTGSLKYSLIYVPEGNKSFDEDADIFEKTEEVEPDSESDHLIDIFTKAISDIDPKMTVKKFTGESKDRDRTLAAFADGTLQVLTSMKCLDEGVDVPRSELAIFCASTGNPRQFIQRRGRVLRTHPDKKMAILHDLVVIPKVREGCPSYKMEQALLKTELKRVCNFAMLSENSSYAQMELLDVMNYYGLNLFNNDHI